MRRFAPLFALLLAGCGGHGGGSPSSSAATTSVGKGPGRAVLTVRWPARTNARLIPNAANSIVVNLLQGTAVVASRTIPRPAAGGTSTSVNLIGLAYGAYGVQVGAFPSTDGSGVSQAGGSGTMTVTEDTPGTLSVAMGSTVAALSITPASPVVATNGATTLAASATDATGAVVLLAAGGGAEALVWTSDSAAATVTGTGPTATLAGGAGAGTAHVTASLRVDDAGTLRSASADVRVLVPTVLPIAPSYAQTTRSSRGGQTYVDGLKDGVEFSLLGPTYYFWNAEFPLSNVPAGATIVSATITTSVSSLSSTAFTSSCQVTGGSTTLSSSFRSYLGSKTLEATAAVKAAFASSTPSVGLAVGGSASPPGDPSAPQSFIATWTAPTLTVTYIGP